MNKNIVWIVVAVVMVAVIVFLLWPDEKRLEVPVITEVETPEVSPNANPLQSVKPSANPLEKTNPFKNDYKNPFE